ncbi:MAG: hypothetical protein H0U27_14950, partial [Nitrosopumilus sp.]|nr:hypothetical protein [Nitrosopumilus sp.]
PIFLWKTLSLYQIGYPILDNNITAMHNPVTRYIGDKLPRWVDLNDKMGTQVDAILKVINSLEYDMARLDDKSIDLTHEIMMGIQGNATKVSETPETIELQEVSGNL